MITKIKTIKTLIWRYIGLSVPAILLLLWSFVGSCYYWYYAGNTHYQHPSNKIFLLGVTIDVGILFILLMVTIIYIIRFFWRLYKRMYLNGIIYFVLIVINSITYYAVYTYRMPFYIPFSKGLKQYIERQNVIPVLQDWIDSDSMNDKLAKGPILISRYDHPSVPTAIQNDIKRFSPMDIDIHILPGGIKCLTLTHYAGIIGEFGFVIGIDKNGLPDDKRHGFEYREELGHSSFVWIRPRQ